MLLEGEQAVQEEWVDRELEVEANIQGQLERVEELLVPIQEAVKTGEQEDTLGEEAGEEVTAAEEEELGKVAAALPTMGWLAPTASTHRGDGPVVGAWEPPTG